MHEILYRFLVFLWFLFYMAAVYLALHIIAARVSRAPESRLLWFFGIITAPLTRPLRPLLPPGISEGRIRLIALGTYVALLVAARLAVSSLGRTPLG
jgi:surface polysaccharide O-acyltransferase-like enzyme